MLKVIGRRDLDSEAKTKSFQLPTLSPEISFGPLDCLTFGPNGLKFCYSFKPILAVYIFERRKSLLVTRLKFLL